MKHRAYRMRLSGDAEAVVLLRQRIPSSWDSLGEMREVGRAINLIFPKVVVDYISIQRPVSRAPQRVKTL